MITSSTVARIAGNLLSGYSNRRYGATEGMDELVVKHAVALARLIVAEVERTEPKEKEQ